MLSRSGRCRWWSSRRLATDVLTDTQSFLQHCWLLPAPIRMEGLGYGSANEEPQRSRKRWVFGVCAYIRKSGQSLHLIDTLRDGLRISDITLHRMHLRTKRHNSFGPGQTRVCTGSRFWFWPCFQFGCWSPQLSAAGRPASWSTNQDGITVQTVLAARFEFWWLLGLKRRWRKIRMLLWWKRHRLVYKVGLLKRRTQRLSRVLVTCMKTGFPCYQK